MWNIQVEPCHVIASLFRLDNAEADARLIAAAPNMEALLQEWVARGFGGTDDCALGDDKCVLCRTKALLAELQAQSIPF